MTRLVLSLLLATGLTGFAEAQQDNHILPETLVDLEVRTETPPPNGHAQIVEQLRRGVTLQSRTARERSEACSPEREEAIAAWSKKTITMLDAFVRQPRVRDSFYAAQVLYAASRLANCMQVLVPWKQRCLNQARKLAEASEDWYLLPGIWEQEIEVDCYAPREAHERISNLLKKILHAFRLQARRDPKHGLPKLAWAYTCAARRYIYTLYTADKALPLLEEAIQICNSDAAWSLQTAQYLKQLRHEIWVTQPERPLAGTREDARGQAYLLRALAYVDLGRYLDAFVDFDRAERDFRKTDNKHRLANLTHDRGQCLLALGQAEEADRELRKAQRIYTELVDENGVNLTLMLRAEAALHLGSLRQAVRLLEKQSLSDGAVFHVAPLKTRQLLLQVEIARRLGNSAHIGRILARARASAFRVHDTRSLTSIQLAEWDLAASKAEATRALRSVAQLLARCRHHGYRDLELEALVASGILNARAGRTSAALKQLSVSTDLLLRLLKEQVLGLGPDLSDSFRKTHEKALSCVLNILSAAPGQLAPEDCKRAYKVLQVFQGFGLASYLVQSSPALLDLGSDPGIASFRSALRRSRKTIENRERALSLRPRSFSKRLSLVQSCQTLRRDVEILEGQLDQRLRALRLRIGRPHDSGTLTPATPTEVRDALATDEALIEYFSNQDRAVACVTTRVKTQFVSLGRLGDLASPKEQAEAVLLPLYRRCKELRNKKALLIAPSGKLCRIPFEVLPVTSGAKPRLLVQVTRLSYVHSGTVLCRTSALTEARELPKHDYRGAIAFANPKDPAPTRKQAAPALSRATRHGFGPLPGTVQEALAIAKLTSGKEPECLEALTKLVQRSPGAVQGCFTGQDFRLYIGTAASQSNLNELSQSGALEGLRILHLACHAVARRSAPKLSFLRLAASPEGEGGFLTLRDLRRMRLDVRLLALSACSTTTGPIHSFEGSLSLSRAGLAAGAKAVLSTLWDVEDGSAAKLVTDFYEAWLRDGLKPRHALTRAKRQAIARGCPSSVWAAYILWGR